ncbi:MAG: CPBP family intramembrane metalloprotease [Anaerolineaceae bacterium]|nr:CPBP family intramembrane metalloprotease [Anaerolineaceae bacterium]
MQANIDKKRIWIFLAITFGISWLTALVIYLTGGLQNSPMLAIEGAQISLAYLLLATAYMFGPAIGNILTRLITREGKANLLLEPKFDHGRWIFWLLAWLLPGILTILGAAFFFLFFPQYYDPQLGIITQQLEAVGSTTTASPWTIVILQTLQAMLLAPVLNAISTFGEEFGWRGYLQPKLMPLGSRLAVLLTGVIWGIWHAPVILMGYNYGLDYTGAPFLGPLAMILFTVSLAVVFGWLSIKAQSVWPAVIGHGALNGIAAIGILLVKGSPSSLLGPAPTGVIGGLAMLLLAVALLFIPNGLKPKQDTTSVIE